MKYLIYIFVFVLTLTNVPEEPIYINHVSDYPISEVTALMYANQMPPSTIAFPMAKGFGANFNIPSNAPKVYVTNTNARGAGTLHEALTATSTDRHVIFTVGGVFDSGGPYTANGNVFIHGETAPGTGVTLTGSTSGIRFNKSNVIIRNVRYRLNGDTYSQFEFTPTTATDITNFIVDKCSFSFASNSSPSDEMGVGITQFTSYGGVTYNHTIQRCTFAEHSRSVLLYNGTYNTTLYQNYYHDGGFRTPLSNGPFNGSTETVQWESINDLVHNMSSAWSAGIGSKVAMRGCVLSNDGVSLSFAGMLRGEPGNGCTAVAGGAGTPCTTSVESYVYALDNITDGEVEVSNFSGYVFQTPYQPLSVNEADILDSSDINEILDDVGASPRDQYDTFYVNQYLTNGTSYNQRPTTINTGYYSSGTEPTDADNDDMADAWETLHGVDDPEGITTNWTIDGVDWVNHPTDPWTNLEVYWADLLGDWSALNAETVVVPPPQENSVYVSTTGSDVTGDGSLNSPYATFSAAYGSVPNNGTIVYRGGTYSNPTRFANTGKSGVTITNYQSEPVVWSGSSGIYIQDDNTTVQGDITITNFYGSFTYGVYIGPGSDNITIDGLTIHDFGYIETEVALPASGDNSNAIIAFCDTEACTNITVRNLEVYNGILGWSEAVSFAGDVDGILAEDVIVRDNTNIGIDAVGNFGYATFMGAVDKARNVVFRRVTSYNNISEVATSAGIYTDGADNVIIEQCISYNNGYGIEIGAEEIGISDNITVRNNIVYNNTHAGIQIGGWNFPTTGEVNNAYVFNNTIVDNDTSGSGLDEFSQNYVETMEVRGNLIVSSDVGWYNVGNANSTGVVQSENYFNTDGTVIFTDYAAKDFTLRSGSPAIDFVSPNATFTTDYLGNPRVGNYDAGAYEFEAPVPPPINQSKKKKKKYILWW